MIFVGILAWTLSGVAAGSGSRSVDQNGVVEIKISPPSSVGAWAVEESVLSGLTPSDINEEGRFDRDGGVIRWGPFFSAASKTLSYTLAGPGGSFPLTGQVSFNGETVAIGGSSSIQLGRSLEPTSPTPTSPARVIKGDQISIRIVPNSSTGAWAVEEELPVGLTATDISEEGRFDERTGVIRWGPYFSASPKTLAYRVVGSIGAYEINGTVSFDGQAVSVGGDRIVERSATLPGGGGGKVSTTVVRDHVGGRVTIAVTPDPLTGSWALEEMVPIGVSVVGINESGTFDPSLGVLRWGPFFSASPLKLQYEIEGPAGTHSVRGIASFDGQGVEVTGVAVVQVASTHVVITPEPSHVAERSVDGPSISIRVIPAPGTGAWAVEELLEGTLSPSEISDGGRFDSSSSTLRWGPFFSDSPVVLNYVLDGEPGRYAINGMASFDGVAVSIDGATEMFLSPPESKDEIAAGTLLFTNIIGGQMRPILDSSGQPLATDGIRVELLVGGDREQLKSVATTDLFGPGLFSGGAVTLPVSTANSSIWIQVRAWQESSGSTYELASIRGESSVFSVSFAASMPGLPVLPREIHGFESFAILGAKQVGEFASSRVVRNRSGNGLMLEWDSQKGTNYTIETSFDFDVWSPAFGPLPGSGKVEQFPIVVSGSNQAAFFRVRVEGR